MGTGTQRTFEDLEIGERYEPAGRTVTESDIRMFVGASGSTNAIHVDREYAAAHPLVDDVVLQGTLTLGVADGMVVEAVGGETALTMNYGHDRVRYPRPVYPGDTLSATVEVVELERKSAEWGVVVLAVELTNQADEVVMVERHRLLVATAQNPHVE